MRPSTACPAQPVLPVNNQQDGQVRLQTANAGKSSSDVTALILAGKEAAAAGRMRDAEVSFLMACAAADKSGRSGSTEPADARYQLGRHYANVALSNETMRQEWRTELLKRAETLYADSLQAYRTRHGEGHEKTHFAAEGLAMVRQGLGQAGVPATAAAPSRPVQTAVKPPVPERPAPVIAARPVEPARTVAQAIPIAPSAPLVQPKPRPRPLEPTVTPWVRQATGEATQAQGQVAWAGAGTGAGAGPSFDCGKARSPSERTICSDSELAQLDRSLGRLHARARNAAPDAAAFRRRNDQEWRRRESSCRGDRECLLDWYAHRRGQLLDDIDESR